MTGFSRSVRGDVDDLVAQLQEQLAHADLQLVAAAAALRSSTAVHRAAGALRQSFVVPGLPR